MLICFLTPLDCQKADITFLIDASGSITERNSTNWDSLLGFLRDIISSPMLQIGGDNVQVAAISYSNEAAVEFFLDETRDLAQVSERIMNIGYIGGRTNIAHALELARTVVFNHTRGDREYVRNIAVLVTDGIANERVDETMIQAELTKRAGIFLVCVGITDAINEHELRIMSSNNQTLKVKDFSSLNLILQDLIDVTCQLPPPGKCLRLAHVNKAQDLEKTD